TPGTLWGRPPPRPGLALNGGGPLATLGAALDDTLAVADPLTVTATPGVVIQIGDERMLVTALDLTGQALTVTRGYGGPTPTAHDAGAPIYPATDQRGLARVVGGQADVGAFASPSRAASPSAGWRRRAW